MYVGLSEQIASQSASSFNGLDRFITLLIAAYCVWCVKNALSTGTIPLKFSTIRRSELTPLFWFAVVIHCVGGLWLFIGAITGKLHW
jgi:hypothetical protein